MNQRIEKLFDQAKIECSKMGSKPAIAVGLDELEKFAELIVKECIDVMKQNDYHGEWLGERIKEHFGVES